MSLSRMVGLDLAAHVHALPTYNAILGQNATSSLRIYAARRKPGPKMPMNTAALATPAAIQAQLKRKDSCAVPAFGRPRRSSAGNSNKPTMAPNPVAAPDVRMNQGLTGLKTAPAV